MALKKWAKVARFFADVARIGFRGGGFFFEGLKTWH